MKKIELIVADVTYNKENESCTLILNEIHKDRKLPISIGVYEGQAIAIVLESLTPVRPLTHDLTHNICISFNIKLTEIIISDYKDGVFYTVMVLSDGSQTHHIDARTSDAVALALRFNAPIYTYDYILSEASFLTETFKLLDNENIQEYVEDDFAKYTLQELYQLLHLALENENYEQASILRDEIEKRDPQQKQDNLNF